MPLCSDVRTIFDNSTARSMSGPSCSSSPSAASSLKACLSGVSSLMVFTSFVACGQAI